MENEKMNEENKLENAQEIFPESTNSSKTTIDENNSVNNSDKSDLSKNSIANKSVELKNAKPKLASINQNKKSSNNENAVASHKRVLQGKVKSNKCDKTIIVAIEKQVAHPLYKKYYKRTKRVMAHDVNNECRIGDTVRVKECRPLSAKKRWTLFEIVERAK